MKERLVNIFNALHNVETKGPNTLIMADVLRELADIINGLDKEKEEKKTK